jgi:alkylation response protein AidB-like acyl-CoA dehydrogenase
VPNFFRDNPDLRRRLDATAWEAIVPALERNFTDTDEMAPANLEDSVEQIEMVLELVGEMAADAVAPHAAEVDRVGAQLVDGKVVYPEPMQKAIEMLAEAGLMGFTLPREFGGLNLPVTAYTAAVELISRADASLMTLFALQGCSESIHRFGSRALHEEFLPRLCAGEISPCMALTEPNAGSALGDANCRASLEDGEWTIEGSKCWITNGGADLLLVLCRTEDKPGGDGLTLLVAEKDDTVEVAKLEEKLGIHGSATAVVNFNRTPARLLGGRGEGLYRVTLGLLHNVRLEVAAQAVGIAHAAQVEAARYAQERFQFGRSIDRFAPVRQLLFRNALQIEAARAVVYTTAAIVDKRRGIERNGGGEELERMEKLADLMTPLSKYTACEMVNEVTSRALQVHGGYGYSSEYAVERHLRDGRITNIYEGTSEIQAGALISALLRDGLPLLFEEPLRDATEPEEFPEQCAGLIGKLRASYETLLAAAPIAIAAGRLAEQGWAREFADATAALVAALVFLRDAGSASASAAGSTAKRSAYLSRVQADVAQRLAQNLLQTVSESQDLAFRDESFDAVLEPYRGDS